MSSATKKMTVEEFEVYAATHGRCELIHGEVRDMTPVSFGHGAVTSRLHYQFAMHVYAEGLGELYAAETGFRFDEASGSMVRAPDIAFISRERLPQADPASFAEIAPDIVVETVSQSDTVTGVNEKILWWLSKGVQEAWVVDPGNQTIVLHWPEGTSQRFGLDQEIEASRVLPGLRVDMHQVFARRARG